MTDVEQHLRDRLTGLARRAPRSDDTAARVLDRRTLRRRRRAAQVAGATAVVVAAVLAVVPGQPGEPARAPVGTVQLVPPTGPSLYDVPTRGSLAGDAVFVAGVQAVEWASPPNAALGVLSPPAHTRRVLFAGDVPGGHRWALVMGRVGDELRTAWFAGPTGTPPERLTLWLGTGEAAPHVPITLQDAGAPTGPLVVVGLPGDRVEYSPGQERDATGRLVRSYAELPVVDGVSLGEVSTPLVADAGIAIAYRDGRVVAAGAPRTLHTPLRGVPQHPDPDAAYWLRLRDCLTPQGFRVTLRPSGRDLTWTGGPVTAPDGGPLSSAEQAQNAVVFDRCAEDVRQG